MLWSSDLTTSVEALTGLPLPEDFVTAINEYTFPDRLVRLGLFTKPHQFADWMRTGLGTAKFLAFLESNSNAFFVGTTEPLRGVVAADGVMLRDTLGGLTHANVAGFLAMLDRTADHRHKDHIELIADPSLYDVIADERIVAAADAIIKRELDDDCDHALCYFAAASEDLSIRLLSHRNFQVVEAAAHRLGRMCSKSAIPSLTLLATRTALTGQVDQHIRAAQLALQQIAASPGGIQLSGT